MIGLRKTGAEVSVFYQCPHGLKIFQLIGEVLREHDFKIENVTIADWNRK